MPSRRGRDSDVVEDSEQSGFDGDTFSIESADTQGFGGDAESVQARDVEHDILKWLDDYYLSWLERDRKVNDLFVGLVDEAEE